MYCIECGKEIEEGAGHFTWYYDGQNLTMISDKDGSTITVQVYGNESEFDSGFHYTKQ